MKIILCVKQVPDTTDIKWTENNTIQREGLESIMNPYDVSALDFALSVKERCNNSEITVLTMGPSQAEKILRKSVAVGVDRGVLLSDKKFAGADTYATGKTIASAIKSKLGDFNMILCGQFAVDGDTAQTGPSIANFLELPQITYVKELSECSDTELTVVRETDYGEETVKVKLPAVVCMLKNEKEPVRATINGVKKAQRAKIEVLGIEDIDLAPEQTGLKGSPTYVNKAFRAPKKEVECKFIDNEDELMQVISECRGENE